jgi:hypothetical protein
MVLENIFFKLANHKQELPVVAILDVRLARNMEIGTGSPTHHSYKVTIQCAY